MAFFQKHPLLVCLLILLLILLLWSLWQTHTPKTTFYTVRSGNIPAAFDGLRILQVSDLHNTQFGKDNQKLLTLVKEAKPDIILLTGDLIDSHRTDPQISIAFCKECVAVAPTYYVPGNHESRVPEAYAVLKAGLADCGVTILENRSVPISRGRETITLTGLMDPTFVDPATVLPTLAADNYQVVLSHRPELLELYAQYGLDLVFSGHAHGGQFRLPFIGGLFAPHQGFFPEYDAGLFTQADTTMVVSRGLGNPLFPPRFNNPPELILVTLESV